MYTYKYPRPALTTDTVVFGYDIDSNTLNVLLIERKNEPFKGMYAIPGGFVDMDETVEDCAARELEEETGLKNLPLVQMHTFSEPDRDPRGRTVSVAFFSLVPKNNLHPHAGDDAKNLKWFDLFKLPPMAFDHQKIIDFAVKFAYENFACQNSRDSFAVFVDYFTVEQLTGIINKLKRYDSTRAL